MEASALIDRIHDNEIQKIAAILSMHLPVDYLVVFDLIRRFSSIDVAIQVVHIALRAGRDPLSYNLNEALGTILNNVTTSMEG